MATRGTVVAVHRSPSHTFSKPSCQAITLVAGLGVEGDAHAGATVRHRSRVARDPSQPNLRQVHLIHAELHERLRAQGFRAGPGDMGENITTAGRDLLALPRGTRLLFARGAIVELTGLRNPCRQLDTFEPGLMAAVLEHGDDGSLIRLAGVMGIVVRGGEVAAGDGVEAELPAAPHRALEPV